MPSSVRVGSVFVRLINKTSVCLYVKCVLWWIVFDKLLMVLWWWWPRNTDEERTRVNESQHRNETKWVHRNVSNFSLKSFFCDLTLTHTARTLNAGTTNTIHVRMNFMVECRRRICISVNILSAKFFRGEIIMFLFWRSLDQRSYWPTNWLTEKKTDLDHNELRM